jgi:hypothetical protein
MRLTQQAWPAYTSFRVRVSSLPAASGRAQQQNTNPHKVLAGLLEPAGLEGGAHYRLDAWQNRANAKSR